jgi:signal transduction histidine kinase
LTGLALLLWVALVLALGLSLLVQPRAAAPAGCTAQVLAVQAAPSPAGSTARPTQGWVPVQLPDTWTRRWPQHTGSVWYRVDWQRLCAENLDTHENTPPEPIALGIDGLSVAGEVFINQDWLWRDASLVEPMSRSWNAARWWLLPESALLPGVNTVWVRAVGHAALSPGMGHLRLGDAASVAQAQAQRHWLQRGIYGVNAILAAVACVLFGLVWLLRRQEKAYGWFALMCLCWLYYLSAYLAESAWPFADTLTRARSHMVALVGYVLCTCLFTFRFGAQRLPRVEQVLWALAAVGCAISLWVPDAQASPWFGRVWLGTLLVFLLNGLQFQRHAWWPRHGPRQPRHMLLALCWGVFALIALHEFSMALGGWQVARSWAALSGLLIITLMTLLLGGQLAQQMSTVERFNRLLAQRVAHTRAELGTALAVQHAQALEHARLQTRMQLAHDLHDGLGAGLVRGMALIEQAPEAMNRARMLSLLKSLRDDLRQLIDQGAGEGNPVPDTPVQWLAPLRHRFTRILDELDVDTSWQIPASWALLGGPPSALQCLGLMRILEETLSNVIKHSHARHVRVICEPVGPDALVVRVEDDGVGFDVAAVQTAGQSVGMRSMAARAERIGAVLDVSSGVCGTVVRVTVSLLNAPQPLGNRVPLDLVN